MPADHPSFLRWTLLTGAVLGSAWVYYATAIAPLRVQAAELIRRQRELQEQVLSTRQMLVGLKDSDQTVAEARARLNGMIEGKGKGGMMSFSAEMKEYFTRFGMPSATVRFVATEDVPGLPGYSKVHWAIGLPLANTDRNGEGVLLATAALEQEDRYLKMTHFDLQPDAADPTQRVASVNVVVLSRK